METLMKGNIKVSAEVFLHTADQYIQCVAFVQNEVLKRISIHGQGSVTIGDNRIIFNELTNITPLVIGPA